MNEKQNFESHIKRTSKKKNIIFMIADGFGQTSETFAQTYIQHVKGFKYDFKIPLDEILVRLSRTRSSDRYCGFRILLYDFRMMKKE